MTDQSLTASSAPAMACPAMKVFGVPELLEHILFLAVSDQWLGNHSKLNFGPMPGCGKLREGGICLFRIQRVDRTFKNTIVGSPKLRQLMFLAPTNHSEGRDAAEDVIEDGTQEELDSDHAKDLLPDHNPFSCLVDPFDHSISFYQMVTSHLGSGWWNREASWKKIPISNHTDAMPSDVEIEYNEESGTGLLEITRKLPGDTTFGYMFGLFCEMLRHLDQRRTAIRAMNKKLTLEDDALEQGLRQEVHKAMSNADTAAAFGRSGMIQNK
ncbi:hypothetical protein Slin15195_G048700 [Septoria linicola]|uniref:Uncharacterized protein n=1 Tax=Septoria linicola TaxID=215465 RepID=A0A9Q9AVP5_9PEZI|nr:hypothetical protein Slin15195_G048700 [Septoria linicola]